MAMTFNQKTMTEKSNVMGCKKPLTQITNWPASTFPGGPLPQRILYILYSKAEHSSDLINHNAKIKMSRSSSRDSGELSGRGLKIKRSVQFASPNLY